MPNALKGEVSIEVEGRTYTLVFDYEAMCLVENALDTEFEALLRKVRPPVIQDGRMITPPKIRRADLRAMAWAALRKHHPDLDLQAVGELINKGGLVEGPMNFALVVLAALGMAFPRPGDDQDGEGAAGDADPQQGATGDGPSPSISEPGANSASALPMTSGG